MKTDKPAHGSGKTRFNRIKARGESWVKLRDEAKSRGEWRRGEKESHNAVDKTERL
jgi:hypothetical protein